MKPRYAVVTAIAGLLCASGLAVAQDAITAPAQKTMGAHSTAMVPSLADLNSGGAKLDNGKLTMSGIAPNSIVFADRPVRAAGHVLTSDFIKQWDLGNDSFAKDPPNATISVMSSDGSAIDDTVVVLKTPKLGDTLTFDVSVLEGLPGQTGRLRCSSTGSPRAAALAMSASLAASASMPPVWHGGWYAHPGAYYGAGLATGAMIGAAAASAYRPYYPPPACGYYPYPPCY